MVESTNQVFNYKLDGRTQKDHDTLWQYDGKDKLTLNMTSTGNWKGVITGTEYTAKEDMTLPYDVIAEIIMFIEAGDIHQGWNQLSFYLSLINNTNDDIIKLLRLFWDAQKMRMGL